MKNIKQLRLSVLFLLGATLIWSSGCKQEEPVTRNCDTYGTFVSVSCGASILNNSLWIKLDNGKLLQPCETEMVYRCPPDYQAGQRIKLGYKPIKNGCGYMTNCLLALPPHQVIRITCLEVLPGEPHGECNLSGTVKDYSKLASALPCGWIIEADNGVKVQPHNLPSGFVLRDGMRVTFSYNQLMTFQAICFGAIGGEITCIREQQSWCGNTGTNGL